MTEWARAATALAPADHLRHAERRLARGCARGRRAKGTASRAALVRLDAGGSRGRHAGGRPHAGGPARADRACPRNRSRRAPDAARSPGRTCPRCPAGCLTGLLFVSCRGGGAVPLRGGRRSLRDRSRDDLHPRLPAGGQRGLDLEHGAHRLRRHRRRDPRARRGGAPGVEHHPGIALARLATGDRTSARDVASAHLHGAWGDDEAAGDRPRVPRRRARSPAPPPLPFGAASSGRSPSWDLARSQREALRRGSASSPVSERTTCTTACTATSSP